MSAVLLLVVLLGVLAAMQIAIVLIRVMMLVTVKMKMRNNSTMI